MRILLDESLPRQLARLILDHEVRTVRQMGWAGKRNGLLLRLAAQEFEVFLTADQNVEFQQNLRDFHIAVVVLVAATNRIESLRALVPNLLQALPTANRASLCASKPRAAGRQQSIFLAPSNRNPGP